MATQNHQSKLEIPRTSIPALKNNDFVYLNSGGSGPPPDYVMDGMAEADGKCFGSAYLEGAKFYARCAEVNQRARKAVAELVGAEPQDIALTQNTSQGMSLGVAAMDWNEGDEVITTTTEHPGCIVPLHALVARYGVKVKYLKPPVTADAVRNAVTPNTRLIALSHVDWTTGEVLPLEEIVQIARENDALTLVDGAQSVGDMVTDIPATGADMYAFTGHKWLLGPEGAGGFYVRPGLEETVSSTNLGFAAVADPATFDLEGNYDLKPGAGRFEASTMSHTLAGGLAAAAEAATVRGEAGAKEILRKADFLMDKLSGLPNVTLRTPRPARTGLVSFEIDGIGAKDAVAKLLERRFVLRFLPEPTHYLRASTHLFNTDDELEELSKEVAKL